MIYEPMIRNTVESAVEDYIACNTNVDDDDFAAICDAVMASFRY